MNEMLVPFFSSGIWVVIAFAISFGIEGWDFARKIQKRFLIPVSRDMGKRNK